MAIGARAVPKQKPLVVIDPKTGEAMTAVPAQNVRELYGNTVAYIEDKEHGPMTIHDSETGKVKVAYPTESDETPEPEPQDLTSRDTLDEPLESDQDGLSSGECSPGYYTPDAGTPERSRSNSVEYVVEEPVQASKATFPSLTAFGFFCQSTGNHT